MDTGIDRARWRFTANRRVLPDLQLGLEFNAVLGEVNPLATWFVVNETARRPGLFLGTSSDRIGSPEGTQATYLTAVKSLPALDASVYVSLNHSELDDGFNVPFGAAKGLGRGLAVRWMDDGARSHALLDYDLGGGAGASLMWVWLERFGIALHAGF